MLHSEEGVKASSSLMMELAGLPSFCCGDPSPSTFPCPAAAVVWATAASAGATPPLTPPLDVTCMHKRNYAMYTNFTSHGFKITMQPH